ncbi:MAG: DUF429 domain-containing protein [Chromatiales bacterium]|nr:DUF429 domain-containing protein [Chromatiales bacterium]
MEDAFVGIDVAIAKKKRLPIVVCTKRQGRLLPLPLSIEPHALPPAGIGNAGVLDEARVRQFAQETVAYLKAVAAREKLVIRRIAIDAPRAPALADTGRRQCEQALNVAGISCFSTPTAEQFAEVTAKARAHLASGGPLAHLPYANKLWMLAGFELFSQLGRFAECREVYPHAIAVALAASRSHKSAPGAALAQLMAASRYTGWPHPETAMRELRVIGKGNDHDRVDAYLSAWVASLEESELYASGAPPDDVIWVPSLVEAVPRWTDMPAAESRLQTKGAEARSSSQRTSRQLVCPACNQHMFKAWPSGWDAHAAHRCAGVSGTSPEQRKAEYKRCFSHLFPNRQ